MSAYDYIPIEPHGMSEWTLFVFVILGIATMVSLKLLTVWKINHDTHMEKQIRRIDAHDQQLNNVSTDLIVIKNDIGHMKNSLEHIKKPLDDMSELNKMVLAKVLEQNNDQ